MGNTVADWLALLDRRYPPSWAASWDHVGLQVGDPSWPVARVLVTLDVTGGVLDEAADVDGTLVVAHHPLLFRPLAALTPASAAGRLALKAASARIPVTAVHTNLDVAGDGSGTSEPVADVLDLADRRSLTTELAESDLCKLVTFVPADHTEAVIDALAAAGAGRDGNYERCSFRVRGIGTFRPLAGADPFVGAIGEDAAEDEFRVEMQLPRRLAGPVANALLATHPYEEVAYDLLPLFDGAAVGFGVVGRLATPARLADVAAAIRERLPAPHLRFAGDPDRAVTTVAVVGGAGDSLLDAARGVEADVYVTGDLRHHVALDALEQGLAVIDAGHHATEAAAMPAFAARLDEDARREGLTAAVVASRTPTVPWS
ncbi:MAG: Nif3-like dinuclear metal center hexameric protein [Nitriliruptoraceae bacterium]